MLEHLFKAEVFKSDFEAERQAREECQSQKETLLHDMEELRTQNLQLLEELQTFSTGKQVYGLQ